MSLRASSERASASNLKVTSNPGIYDSLQGVRHRDVRGSVDRHALVHLHDMQDCDRCLQNIVHEKDSLGTLLADLEVARETPAANVVLMPRETKRSLDPRWKA